MSTTITYKDNLLTTVDNSIKILRTAGKYLEGDIVVTDITAKSQANENDPIRFFDYDGTIVASYTEVPESLPPNPTHEGLTAQGWNWTLEDIASQFESTGVCDIGQMYITDDGKTRIHVTVSDMTKSFWLGLCPNGTLSIDWGDGSENSSMTGTSYSTIKTIQHTYATAGSYVISIEVESGKFAFYNTDDDYTRLLGKYGGIGNYYNHSYGGCVTAIELGDNAMISYNAFTKLFNMRSITIPDSITNINDNAFSYCYALKSITIPDGVTKVATGTFSACYALESVTIPNGVTSIGNNAFSSCYALKSISLPDRVTSIGNGAFSACFALESITIPDSITKISSNMFSACYALKRITIPDGVTVISNSAFSNCYALKHITIPDSVTSVSFNAFSGCNTLESIIIPDNITSISHSMFQDCYSLKYITIPNSITSIGNSAFSNCYVFEFITIPDSVTDIGNAAFSNCYALKHIIIPDGITNIGTYTFSNCYSLKSITIPDSVTKINGNAFQGCYNMDEYHFLPTTPPTLANPNTFQDIQSSCKIYVPYSEDHSVLNAYKTATNWSAYAKYIVEEGE